MTYYKDPRYVAPVRLLNGDWKVGNTVYDIQRDSARGGWEINWEVGAEPRQMYISDELIGIIASIKDGWKSIKVAL